MDQALERLDDRACAQGHQILLCGGQVRTPSFQEHGFDLVDPLLRAAQLDPELAT